MVEIILYFLGFLVALMGLASFIKGAVSYGGKGKVKPTETPYTPPVSPPAMLDSAEIQHLGEEAAAWCETWMQHRSVSHKWVVIEVSRKYMDCRGVDYTVDPSIGYPHCHIEFSKEITEENRIPVVQQILDIISDKCPEMISVYGLYRDGGYLILPTNSE